jgi:3-hydroxybutyrate dehydrogenase
MDALDGRHALITGGGTVIGAAIAGTLAGAGTSISIARRRREPLAKVAAGLENAVAIIADMTREADSEAMVSAARKGHRPIDIVIAIIPYLDGIATRIRGRGLRA